MEGFTAEPTEEPVHVIVPEDVLIGALLELAKDNERSSVVADWASDEARQLGEANNLSVEQLEPGSGTDGNVTVADVRNALGPAVEDGTGVKVRPHKEAGAKVVLGPQEEDGEPVVVVVGSVIDRALFDHLQEPENYARGTFRYPDGYPLVVDYEEGE